MRQAAKPKDFLFDELLVLGFGILYFSLKEALAPFGGIFVTEISNIRISVLAPINIPNVQFDLRG